MDFNGHQPKMWFQVLNLMVAFLVPFSIGYIVATLLKTFTSAKSLNNLYSIPKLTENFCQTDGQMDVVISAGKAFSKWFLYLKLAVCLLSLWITKFTYSYHFSLSHFIKIFRYTCIIFNRIGGHRYIAQVRFSNCLISQKFYYNEYIPLLFLTI